MLAAIGQNLRVCVDSKRFSMNLRESGQHLDSRAIASDLSRKATLSNNGIRGQRTHAGLPLSETEPLSDPYHLRFDFDSDFSTPVSIS